MVAKPSSQGALWHSRAVYDHCHTDRFQLRTTCNWESIFGSKYGGNLSVAAGSIPTITYFFQEQNVKNLVKACVNLLLSSASSMF